MNESLTPAEVMALKKEILSSLHCALPGTVESYDPESNTAVIRPAGNSLPLLRDVPVHMPVGFAVSPGDRCLVVFADFDTEAWLNGEDTGVPLSKRMHSLSDGFAFVGFSESGVPPVPGPGDYVTGVRMNGNSPVLPDENGTADLGGIAAVFTLGSVASPVTDLAAIPLNSTGNVILAAGISPSGILRSHSYLKCGSSASRWFLIAHDQYANATWLNENYDGELKGWKRLLDSTRVANTLDVADAGFVLDARQGKALNDAAVHKAGTETVTGLKTFRNSATSPSVRFQGADLGAIGAVLYAAGCETQAGKYGKPYFLFREYSPEADGSARTSCYEDYKLPQPAEGRSGNASYSILTEKEFPFVRINGVSPGGTAAGDGTNKISFTAPGSYRNALVCCADKHFTVYYVTSSGTAVYSDGLPSGWTLTRSGATYTLTRNATQSFYYTVLWI